jgi:hypothetical protein
MLSVQNIYGQLSVISANRFVYSSYEYVYHYLFLLVTSNLVNRWMVDLCSTFILEFFLHLYGGILSLLKVFKWSCFYMSYVAGCVSTCRMWLFNSWHSACSVGWWLMAGAGLF